MAMFTGWWGKSEKIEIEEKNKPEVRLWADKLPCQFVPCQQESAYVKERQKVVTKALEKFLPQKYTKDSQKIVRIALCGSGGGMRAMYAFDAALKALDIKGLLDAIIYITTLSGSTWALGPWAASGKKSYLDFEADFLKHVQEKAGEYFSTTSSVNILETTRKSIKHLSVTEVYSGKLGRMLFGKKKLWENITLGSLQKNLNNGAMPLPIFTAIMVPPNLWEQGEMLILTKPTAYWWCEMTPFEAACYDFCAAVPIDSFNSRFVGGKWEQSARKPFNLVEILGLCSSAYAMTLSEYNKPINTWINSVRLAAQMVGNPVYKLTECPNKLATEKERLPIIDAGISFNLPLPPLLHRDQAERLDLIIVIDVTGNIPLSNGLFQAKMYAKAKGLRFPSLDSVPNYQQRPYTLFGDPSDPKDLMLLYIPLVQNPLYKDIEKQIDDLFSSMKEDLEKEELEEKAEFLQDRLAAVLNYCQNDQNECVDFQKLKDNLDLIIRAQGFNAGDYKTAIKFVEKMLSLTFDRADSGFMKTTNFEYKPEEVGLLQSIFTVAIEQAFPTIIKALGKRAVALNGGTKEEVIGKNEEQGTGDEKLVF